MYSGAYSIPAIIDIAAKIACIIHLLRTGRSMMWIWLILFFPIGGSLIYFFIEVWPDLKRGRSDLGLNVRLPQNPEKVIARLTEELEYSNTVEKRVQLARAYAAAGKYPQAIETVNACLRGVFKDDPLLTLELAELYSGCGRYQEALDSLHTLERLNFKDRRYERKVLAARCHEQLGQLSEARFTYEQAMQIAVGEEARCRYAALLAREGEIATARTLFEEIVRNAKHGGGAYRRHNQLWIKEAKAQLEKLGRT